MRRRSLILIVAAIIIFGGFVSLCIGITKSNSKTRAPEPVIRPRVPLSEVPAGPVEIRGFAWSSNGTYPTLAGPQAVYYEFRLERENVKGNTSTWERVFQWRSDDPFYIVDRSGAARVPVDQVAIDTEDWSTHYWKQLAPAQRDLLLQGVLQSAVEGAGLPDFPPMEQTVTGPFQPRFRVYERAVFIGSPIKISGELEKSPTSAPLARPGLNEFLTENRTPDGELRNLQNVLIAHRGSGMTVKEARDQSILGAELAVASQGARSVVPVPAFGSFKPSAKIHDLFDIENRPVAQPSPPPLKALGAIAMLAGLLIGAPALQTELAKPGPIAEFYTASRAALGIPLAKPEPKLKIVRRPKTNTDQNAGQNTGQNTGEATQASVNKVKLPPPPSQIDAQVLSSEQIENWKIPAGASRWPVIGDTFVAVLRPPSLKAENLLPYRPLAHDSGFSFVQNRWLGLSEVADPNGLVPFAVWDLDTNRVMGRVFEKGLLGATVLTAERVLTLSQVSPQPALLRIWDLKTAKVLSELPLPPGQVGSMILTPNRALVLVGQPPANSTEVIYDGYAWEPEKTALTKMSLEITKPTIHLSPNGRWTAIASGERIVVLDNTSTRAQLISVPSAKPTTKNELLGFSADDRLLILQDRANLFAAGSFDSKLMIEMLAPLSGDLLAVTDDLRAALVKNTENPGLSLRFLLDPSKTKSVCNTDCYKGSNLAHASISPDGRWLYVPVTASRFEMTFREAAGDKIYSPDYEVSSRLAGYAGSPPSASLEDCLTFAAGCFKTGTTALAANEIGRAYAYLYGACRGGRFEACAEISRSAAALKISNAQADSFSEFGCRFQNAASCALRTPAQAAPQAPAVAPPAATSTK